MVQLYDLYIQRYHELREHIHVVKYEDVIDDPASLSRLCGQEAAPPLAAAITSRTRMVKQEDGVRLRKSLNRYGLFTRLYYPEA